MATRKKSEGETKRSYAPGRTSDEITNRNISLAVNLAAKQLEEGTASPLVIAHYLKLGSPTAQLEQEKLRNENKLVEAKITSLESSQRAEEAYIEVIKALRHYNGTESSEDE